MRLHAFYVIALENFIRFILEEADESISTMALQNQSEAKIANYIWFHIKILYLLVTLVGILVFLSILCTFGWAYFASCSNKMDSYTIHEMKVTRNRRDLQKAGYADREAQDAKKASRYLQKRRNNASNDWVWMSSFSRIPVIFFTFSVIKSIISNYYY